MKFGEWLTMYIENYKKGTVQDRWYEQLLLFIEKIPKSLKNKKANAITPVELQKLINDMSAKYSKSYVQKMKALIKSAFNEAQENGIITKNPARKLFTPDKPEKPRQAYTASETATIIKYATKYENRVIGIATITLVLTGIRRGEMLGLTWDDIDDNILHIKRGVYLDNYVPKAEEYRAKTKGSIRSLPLPTSLKKLIMSLPKTGNYIFANTKGNIIEPSNFNVAYKKMIMQIKEQEKELRILSPHCLRHTYATLTLAVDPNLRNVQALLGHSDPKTTARYTHPDMDALRKSSNQLIGLLQDNQQDN